MEILKTPTIWINPAQFPIEQMATPEKITTIIGMLQINDHGRLSSGKTSFKIAEEFTSALTSLSSDEKIELRGILVELPIVPETRKHVERLLGQ